MDKPRRVQRKRSKGWRMPDNTVYVGRPTLWGNMFKSSSYGSAQVAVRQFRELLETGCYTAGANFSFTTSDMQVRAAGIMSDIEELRGKNLACWCPLDRPCHADILLELANKSE